MYSQVKTKKQIASDFQIDTSLLDGLEVLYYSYIEEDYEGEAFGLFKDGNGELFEVNGSHCSCFGLEDQWELEPTTIEALKKRDWYKYQHRKDLLELLGSLKNES